MRKVVLWAVLAGAVAQAGCIALPVPHWKERQLGSSIEARDRHLYVVGFVSVWPEINTEYIVVLNHDPKLAIRVEYDPPGAANSKAISEDAGPIHHKRVGGPYVDAALSPTGKKALVYDRRKDRMLLFDVVEAKVYPLADVPEEVRIWGPVWDEGEASLTYHVQTVQTNGHPYDEPVSVTDVTYEARRADGTWTAKEVGREVRKIAPVSYTTPGLPNGGGEGGGK